MMGEDPETFAEEDIDVSTVNSSGKVTAGLWV